MGKEQLSEFQQECLQKLEKEYLKITKWLKENNISLVDIELMLMSEKWVRDVTPYDRKQIAIETQALEDVPVCLDLRKILLKISGGVSIMCLGSVAKIRSNVPIIGFKVLTKRNNKLISPITERELHSEDGNPILLSDLDNSDKDIIVSKFAICGEDERRTGYFSFLDEENAGDVCCSKDDFILSVILHPRYLLFTDFEQVTTTRLCIPTNQYNEFVFYFKPLAKIFYYLHIFKTQGIRNVFIYHEYPTWKIDVSLNCGIDFVLYSKEVLSVSFIGTPLFYMKFPNEISQGLERLFINYKDFRKNDLNRFDGKWQRSLQEILWVIFENLTTKLRNLAIVHSRMTCKELEEQLYETSFYAHKDDV